MNRLVDQRRWSRGFGWRPLGFLVMNWIWTKLDARTLATIKAQIAYYHALQPLVLKGDFSLLLPRQSNGQNQVAWLLSAHDRKHLVLGFFRVLADADSRTVQYMKVPLAKSDTPYWVNQHTGPISGMSSSALVCAYQSNSTAPIAHKLS